MIPALQECIGLNVETMHQSVTAQVALYFTFLYIIQVQAFQVLGTWFEGNIRKSNDTKSCT